MQPANRQKQAMRRDRDRNGRFAPGSSGNPRGRPAIAAEVRDLARQHGPHAIARLFELSNSEDEAVAEKACRALLDRGYGRPEQSVQLDATLADERHLPDSFIVRSAQDAAQVYQSVMLGHVSLASAVDVFQRAETPPVVSKTSGSPTPPPGPLPPEDSANAVVAPFADFP